ncbi:unnamed protein product [Microthlaspi erraticum]|uniref:Uncharacterized protein n=1 Tax=Microthlaspi erraticum TaxID=1685480 RepID=A0A6D2JRW0_9BRAS|nr:unnamed protein product [Microthlaspi erraticum]
MRVVREKLTFDASSGVGVISLNPTFSVGLVSPYYQQASDVNKMLQNDVTRELYREFKRLQNRAVYCLREKDKVLGEANIKSKRMEDSLMQAVFDVHATKNKEIEEANRKNREMEVSLRQALADVKSWKAVAVNAIQQNALGQDHSKRLHEKRKRETEERNAYKRFAEDNESSTGENGDDDDDDEDDSPWTRMFKRRCL